MTVRITHGSRSVCLAIFVAGASLTAPSVLAQGPSSRLGDPRLIQARIAAAHDGWGSIADGNLTAGFERTEMTFLLRGFALLDEDYPQGIPGNPVETAQGLALTSEGTALAAIDGLIGQREESQSSGIPVPSMSAFVDPFIEGEPEPVLPQPEPPSVSADPSDDTQTNQTVAASRSQAEVEETPPSATENLNTQGAIQLPPSLLPL